MAKPRRGPMCEQRPKQRQACRLRTTSKRTLRFVPISVGSIPYYLKRPVSLKLWHTRCTTRKACHDLREHHEDIRDYAPADPVDTSDHTPP